MSGADSEGPTYSSPCFPSISSAPVEQQLSGAVGRRRNGCGPTGPNWWSYSGEGGSGWAGGGEKSWGWLSLDWVVAGNLDVPFFPVTITLPLDASFALLSWPALLQSVAQSSLSVSLFLSPFSSPIGSTAKSQGPFFCSSGCNSVNVLYLSSCRMTNYCLMY